MAKIGRVLFKQSLLGQVSLSVTCCVCHDIKQGAYRTATEYGQVPQSVAHASFASKKGLPLLPLMHNLVWL